MPRTSTPRPTTDVDSLLDALDHPRRPLIDAIRATIRGADPRIVESVKWNAPSFATTGHFATLHLRTKAGVHVVLHLGAKPQPENGVRAGIEDPAGLLDWRGHDRAIVTVADEADLTAKREAFVALLRQWIEHVP